MFDSGKCCDRLPEELLNNVVTGVEGRQAGSFQDMNYCSWERQQPLIFSTILANSVLFPAFCCLVNNILYQQKSPKQKRVANCQKQLLLVIFISGCPSLYIYSLYCFLVQKSISQMVARSQAHGHAHLWPPPRRPLPFASYRPCPGRKGWGHQKR